MYVGVGMYVCVAVMRHLALVIPVSGGLVPLLTLALLNQGTSPLSYTALYGRCTPTPG